MKTFKFVETCDMRMFKEYIVEAETLDEAKEMVAEGDYDLTAEWDYENGDYLDEYETVIEEIKG